MSNIIRRKYRASRRISQNLWGRAKDPVEVRNYRPGQHGANGRRITSDYGRQLEAKQTLKRHYGRLSEKQFRRIFKEANRQRGDTSANLIGLLESRLDAVVYRAKFTPTIFSARQLVSHKHILVNGSCVNIPSYQVKPGDVIEVKEKSREIPMVIEGKQSAERDVPAYLEFDSTGFKTTFVKRPILEDVPYAVEMSPHLVVEFYSR